MIWGYSAAALFLLAAARFPAARLRRKGTGKSSARLHCLFGAALLLTALLHLWSVWPLRRQRPAALLAVGFFMLACVLLTAFSPLLSKRLGDGWRRLHRTASLLLLTGLLLHTFLWAASLNAYRRSITSISISGDVHVEELADGVYQGECDAAQYIYARVEVQISGGRIEKILLLEHRNERGGPAETVVDAVAARQSLPVDTVTGATNSSLVIEKAIENALKSAPKGT